MGRINVVGSNNPMFYGFLQAGEVLIQNLTQPNILRMRIYQWMIINHHSLQLTKQSKTDPFRKGVTVVIGRAVGPLCPLVATLTWQ